MRARRLALVVVSAWELARLALMIVLIVADHRTDAQLPIEAVWLGAGWACVALLPVAIARKPSLIDQLKPIVVIALLAAVATDAVVLFDAINASATTRIRISIGILLADVLAAAFLVSFPQGGHNDGEEPPLPTFHVTDIEGE